MILRAISALIAVGILLALYYFFQIQGLVASCVIMSLFTSIEYSILVEKNNRWLRALFVVLSYLFFLFFTFISQTFLAFLVCFLVLSVFFLFFTDQDIETRVRTLSKWLAGIIYCGALAGMVTFGLIKYELNYFLALLLICFSTDTLAYAGGKLMGSIHIFPDISPKKTLEGSLAGLIGGTTIGVAFLLYAQVSHSLLLLTLCCALTSMFSQVGDLYESLIKRYSGVKDSGKLIPGHGGVLDRIDGVLFASPVLYLWMLYFNG